jgi:ligand-binding sensor domain-containing protein/signal transduction histidine kinase
MKKWIFSSMFFVLPIAAHAQSTHLIFKQLNRASGLPVDEVTCLAQDSTGFIWIGSKEGLFRYDGFGYKSFYYRPADDKSIPNNFISKIFVANDGLLWVGTSGGLIVMKTNGEVIRIFNFQTNKNFSKESEKIFDIGQAGNYLWITTADGLFRIEKTTGDFRVQRHDLRKEFHFLTNELGSFVFDKNHALWICTIRGLAVFDPATNNLYHSGNNPVSLKILEDKAAIKSVYIDQHKKNISYTTWEPAVKFFDQVLNKVNVLYNGKGSTKPDYTYLVTHYLEDNYGTLWIGSGKGIKMINSKDDHTFSHLPGISTSLGGNQVMAMLLDKEKNLWVATTNGISIAQPYRQNVVNLSLHNANEFPFAAIEVNTIIPADEHSFLIGTGNGLYHTDATFHVQKHYLYGSSAYDWIWNSYYKQGDSILISTQKGMLIYNVTTKEVKKLMSPPFDKFHPVFSFNKDKKGNIWMSRYYDDFMQFNPQTKKYKRYSLSQLGEPATVLKLLVDRENNIWLLSSLSGVLKFDPVTEKITARLPVGKNGLLNTHIIFALDVGQDLLIGYVDHGFSLYNKANRTFQHFGQAEGLASNSVTDAFQTDNNTVWISTTNGISRFDLSSKSFLSYGYANGILQNDFSCITRLPDGRLAAGNNNGLIYFSPDEIKTTQQVKQPVISAINVYGKNFPVDSFSVNRPVSIAYDKNYFSIEYISLQYSNNQQIEYAYKLDGFDKDWIYAGNRRFASYSNLPGGHYSFQLRARLPGSTWSENKMALAVSVATPFFRKWWFIPLCALVVLGLAYALFRYRLKQLIRVENIRQSISSDLHDEVGASLSSISIFSEMARQSLGSGKKAEAYLFRIGERSRESIEKMSDIIWSINPDNDSMEQMLMRMKTFVNETVEGRGIEIHWHEGEGLKTLKLEMSQRKNFYLLFKEAFINSFKYASPENIDITLDVQHNTVFLEVKDDGKGFCMDTAKPGNGIRNMKQRALLLGGKTILQSAPGKGTLVSVSFRI